MKTPKQIATDIFNGDLEAKTELEKMLGKSFDEMTKEERVFGVTFLSAFESGWRANYEAN